MAELKYKLIAFVRKLDNGKLQGEVLRLPAIFAIGDDQKSVLNLLKKSAENFLETVRPENLYQFTLPEKPVAENVEIQVKPQKRSPAWTEPFSINFGVAKWFHKQGGHIAAIPALGIEVVRDTKEELNKALPDEIHAALIRENSFNSLKMTADYLQNISLKAIEIDVEVNVGSSKKRVQDQKESEKLDSLKFMNEIGMRVFSKSSPRAYEMEETVARLAEVIGGENPRCVLLVGPSGVGKTSAFYELVASASNFGLNKQEFWETSGSRLVSGMSGFGMWQERCRNLLEAVSELRAILYMGNLVELMGTGKSIANKQSIASFLRPHLDNGRLTAILECTPEQIPLIEQEDPMLISAFTQVEVPEPDSGKSRNIMLECALKDLKAKSQPTIDETGIELIDRLHRRYTPYSAFPGRPLRFLNGMLRDKQDDEALSLKNITDGFSRETGLPVSLLDDSQKMDEKGVRDWFSNRVMGQDEGVEIISELLAIAKTVLNRPKKPIASLLFIGPTGVGKTQMAKSLAEYLFGDPKRLVRFDMSEFSDPVAVKRLVGGVFGADGLLTTKIREQPFCVLLFDEFEKAHPLFFDILLQVLGEGRLTDAGGRVADFCSSVIIMTSNLGARSFGRGKIGLQEDKNKNEETKSYFAEEVRRFLKPELFNRLDRIVPFLPLPEEVVSSIADREMELVKQRDGMKYRRIKLPDLQKIMPTLVKSGFDERYGARPLKRAIEHDLLVPLANGVNQYSGNIPLTAKTIVQKNKIKVKVKSSDYYDLSIEKDNVILVHIMIKLRRAIYILDQKSSVVQNLRDKIFTAERLKKKRASKKNQDSFTGVKIKSYRKMMDELTDIVSIISEMETKILTSHYCNQALAFSINRVDYKKIEERFYNLLYEIFATTFKNPNLATLGLFSEDDKTLLELGRAYLAIARKKGFSVNLATFVLSENKGTRRRIINLQRIPSKQIDPFIKQKKNIGVLGLCFQFFGPLALPYFLEESGLHRIVWDAHSTTKCLVDVFEGAMDGYSTPPGIERRSGIGSQSTKRRYDIPNKRIEDIDFKGKLNEKSFAKSLSPLLQERLDETVWRIIYS